MRSRRGVTSGRLRLPKVPAFRIHRLAREQRLPALLYHNVRHIRVYLQFPGYPEERAREDDGAVFHENPRPDNEVHETRFVFKRDECPRADTSLEALGKLRPVFKEGGTVTAGNSSPMNDGAAGVIIMSRAKANSLDLKPMAQFISFCFSFLLILGPGLQVNFVVSLIALYKLGTFIAFHIGSSRLPRLPIRTIDLLIYTFRQNVNPSI